MCACCACFPFPWFVYSPCIDACSAYHVSHSAPCIPMPCMYHPSMHVPLYASSILLYAIRPCMLHAYSTLACVWYGYGACTHVFKTQRNANALFIYRMYACVWCVCMCMMLACALPIWYRITHVICTVLPCGTHANASRAWYIVMHTVYCYVRFVKVVHYNQCTMFTFTHACIHMHLPFACTHMQ